MTPNEAIDCAVEAVKGALEDGLVPGGFAYQAFLIQSGEELENAAHALTRIAMNRPDLTDPEVVELEKAAYIQILQGSITTLMALAHFPYLPTIDVKEVREKLCLDSSTDTSES